MDKSVRDTKWDGRDVLKFTVNEQNAMALLCNVMASVAYRFHNEEETPDMKLVEDTLLTILDGCGRSVNWGDMYDRFHRQGVNR